jgi:hypothetical protein
MHNLTSRHCMATCLAFLLIAAGVLSGLDRFGKQSRVAGTAGGLRDPQVVKQLVADPLEAYGVWKRAGYQGRILVYIADRWESFDPGTLIPDRMFRAYPLELYNTARLLEEEHLDPVTFLYVASMNKIVRRIVAVVPGSEVERMRQLVPKVKDSRKNAQGVFLARQGFPRWYTTGANLGALGEPALVYVGASYFKYAEPEELFGQLQAAGVQSDCMLLSREVGKPSVGTGELARLERFARLLGVPAQGTAPGPVAGPEEPASPSGATRPGRLP